MSVMQTIDIPAYDPSVRRQLTINIPNDLPAGRTILTFTPVQKTDEPQEETVKPLASLWGIHKGLDTMDAYFARKRADKAKEDAQIAKQLGVDISFLKTFIKRKEQ